jgi:hypothetical protein
MPAEKFLDRPAVAGLRVAEEAPRFRRVWHVRSYHYFM